MCIRPSPQQDIWVCPEHCDFYGSLWFVLLYHVRHKAHVFVLLLFHNTMEECVLEVNSKRNQNVALIYRLWRSWSLSNDSPRQCQELHDISFQITCRQDSQHLYHCCIIFLPCKWPLSMSSSKHLPLTICMYKWCLISDIWPWYGCRRFKTIKVHLN